MLLDFLVMALRTVRRNRLRYRNASATEKKDEKRSCDRDFYHRTIVRPAHGDFERLPHKKTGGRRCSAVLRLGLGEKLERQHCAKLTAARGYRNAAVLSGRIDQAEVARPECKGRRTEAGVVENVDPVRPEFQVHSLGDAEALRD